MKLSKTGMGTTKLNKDNGIRTYFPIRYKIFRNDEYIIEIMQK